MAETEYKKLSTANVFEPDTASAMLISSRDKWVDRVLSAKLHDSVPEEIATLFESAQGAIVYGYFFYPLISLGGERLHTALETAVRHKCDLLGCPETIYSKRLNWLKDQGLLSAEAHEAWQSLRSLRNEAAHPQFHPLYPPWIALRLLADIASEINALFAPKPTGQP
jgi:hypothetical protein